jgi:DNA repair protein RadC
MTIKDWPVEQRPREKLLLKGSAALTDAELLAIFLRTGRRGCSAVDMAQALIERFGGLRGLLRADEAMFCGYPGLGAAKYAQLQAVMEMARRYLFESMRRGQPLSSPEETRQYLSGCMRDYQHEVFAALFMDQRHRVICFEELFSGTIDGASVHPREVVKKALQYNAAAIIFAHNHPSGVAEPSAADRHITRRLQEALALVDIKVLDHFIVGDKVTSFAERGLL